MPEINSAAEATEVAVTFIKKYYPFPMPRKATKDDGVWTVELDVGLARTRLATIRVDGKTGAVVDYSVAS